MWDTPFGLQWGFPERVAQQSKHNFLQTFSPVTVGPKLAVADLPCAVRVYGWWFKCSSRSKCHFSPI